MSAIKRLLPLTLIAALLASVFSLVWMPAPAQAADSWTAMNSGTVVDLKGVWGASSSNVFAVGAGGTILRYSGASWNPMDSGTSSDLNGIWGSSATNIFAVGAGGTIVRYSGGKWSPMPSGTTEDLNGVWGISGNNVFAVGRLGTILHFDGTSWSVMVSNTAADLYGVWGSSASDIWAVGTANATIHYDGSAWTSTLFPLLNNHKAVWGTSASNVLKVGRGGFFPIGYIEVYDGNSWIGSGLFVLGGLFGIYGTSASDIFAVGGAGGIVHFDGSSWSAPMVIGIANDLFGVWGNCSSNFFAVGASGIILHYGSGCATDRGSLATPMGTVTFKTDSGAIGGLRSLTTADISCSITGYDFPFGLFSFRISNLVPGATARITITLPAPLDMNASYFKCQDGNMVDCSSLVTRPNENTIVLRLTDGGKGDADHAANGTIVDPGGPAVQGRKAPATHGASMPAAPQAPVSLPSISVRSASLSAARVAPGTAVTVTANLANTGAVNGTSSIKVYVNGQEEDSKGVTLTSGSNVPVSFNVSRNEPGTYTVYVGGVSAGSFVVDAMADPNIILFVSGALLLCALVMGVVLIGRKSRKA